jgi:hypothetical protein
MLLVGGKETLESECDLEGSASQDGFSNSTLELRETGKLELFVPGTIKVQIYSLSPSQISVSLFSNLIQVEANCGADSGNLTKQDPAQYLPPTLRLRQRENYSNPEVVGSVTGSFEMTTIEKVRSCVYRAKNGLLTIR